VPHHPLRREEQLQTKALRLQTTRADVAYWTGRTGDAAGARDKYTQLLPTCERILAPNFSLSEAKFQLAKVATRPWI
jgi:hypothetical protein